MTPVNFDQILRSPASQSYPESTVITAISVIIRRSFAIFSPISVFPLKGTTQNGITGKIIVYIKDGVAAEHMHDGNIFRGDMLHTSRLLPPLEGTKKPGN